MILDPDKTNARHARVDALTKDIERLTAEMAATDSSIYDLARVRAGLIIKASAARALRARLMAGEASGVTHTASARDTEILTTYYASIPKRGIAAYLARQFGVSNATVMRIIAWSPRPGTDMQAAANHTGQLGPQQTAELMGIDRATLTRMRVDGRGPACKEIAKNNWRWKRADIEAWIASEDEE